MKKPGLNQDINEKLLGLLVSSVKGYAIFMLDPEGYIISWNKGGENIKGYHKDEIVGMHMSVFYTTADNGKGEPQHNLSEALKNGSYEDEGLRVRKDGSTFWVNVVFTPLYDNDKKLLGFAKVTRDITEQKKEKERKEEINVELERRVKEDTEKIIANELRYDLLIEIRYLSFFSACITKTNTLVRAWAWR
ncbi:MAG TPA: PAS domain-containing protein [Mucilaginibacter sp.]|jgi:PAS domain S-box-containing protein